MKQFFKTNTIPALVLLAVVVVIQYEIEREQFIAFMGLYTIGFAAFIYLYFSWKDKTDLSYIIYFSYLLRFSLLFALPNLSNDFYRFIWDGRMSLSGINPYLVLPNDFAGTENMDLAGKDAAELLEGQGSLSPGNYTCYPPLNQFIFVLSTLLFPNNYYPGLLVMRFILIIADIGTIKLGRKILRKLNLKESNILLYALNPFILFEVTGSLHFEGVTLFFLLLAIDYLLKNRWFISSLFFSLSVSVKLIPLIFLPILLKKLGQRNLIIYVLTVIVGNIILFIPFLNEDLVTNFVSSIDLYFRKFEFNASVYYIIRWIGFKAYGWNIIQKVGPLLGLTVFVITLFFTLLPKNQDILRMLRSMTLAITIYYFLSTTVHPWYLVIPLMLSLFTTFRFTILWSFLIMLSYNAYQSAPYQENLILTGIEYTLVFSFLIFEIQKKRKKQ